MTIHFILILASVVVFVLATINFPARVSLIALGLALFAAAFLLTGCAGSMTAMRENIEQIDFKATYEGAGVGTRVHLREPRRTGYEK